MLGILDILSMAPNETVPELYQYIHKTGNKELVGLRFVFGLYVGFPSLFVYSVYPIFLFPPSLFLIKGFSIVLEIFAFDRREESVLILLFFQGFVISD